MHVFKLHNDIASFS